MNSMSNTLSISNNDILKKYINELMIPNDAMFSKTIIAAIGESFMKGSHHLIPILLIQRRLDISPGSGKKNPADILFRNWKGHENVLRHIENVTVENFREQDFKLGQLLTNVNLGLDISMTPFRKNQRPIINPINNRVVTSQNKPLYRNTRIEFGPVIHTGLDIPRDRTQVNRVADSPSVLDINTQ